MKKLRIGVLVLMIIVVAYLGLYYYSPIPKSSGPEIRPETLSNVTELYSLFTPYMGESINSRLQAIECQANEYYYFNSAICFVCYKYDACFEYAWVNRIGGKKMNPSYVFLNGNYDKNDEINFYSFGIAKLLNCECNEECICEDEIKVNISTNVIFIFPNTMNTTAKLENIAERLGEEKCQISLEGRRFECENLVAQFLDENMVVFGK